MDDLLDSSPHISLAFAFADDTIYAAQGSWVWDCFAASSRSSPFVVFNMEGIAQHLQVRGFLFFTGSTWDEWQSSTCHLHRVYEKKLQHCIRCHNSGKQRRISTKFDTKTARLNCKQVIKFQQNRSTSATATTSFGCLWWTVLLWCCFDLHHFCRSNRSLITEIVLHCYRKVSGAGRIAFCDYMVQFLNIAEDF